MRRAVRQVQSADKRGAQIAIELKGVASHTFLLILMGPILHRAVSLRDAKFAALAAHENSFEPVARAGQSRLAFALHAGFGEDDDGDASRRRHAIGVLVRMRQVAGKGQHVAGAHSKASPATVMRTLPSMQLKNSRVPGRWGVPPMIAPGAKSITSIIESGTGSGTSGRRLTPRPLCA